MNEPGLVIIVLIGVLLAIGVDLVLQRSLIRIVIGFMLISHGANLALLAAGGPAGAPPLLGGGAEKMTDPLPQAMALTAIVISFGISSFLLALAFRGWVHHGEDEVRDDIEDRGLRSRGPAEDDR